MHVKVESKCKIIIQDSEEFRAARGKSIKVKLIKKQKKQVKYNALKLN